MLKIIATTLICLITASPSAWAQTANKDAPAKLPEWDVVSVKPLPNEPCKASGLMPTADGINIFCVPLLIIIEQAYGIRESGRILGLPAWVKNSNMFDITARVAAEDVPAFEKLSPKDKYRMLQSALADRFHMKAHIEQREIPIYEMVVAKDGPKLKEATPDEVDKAHMLSHGTGQIESVAAALTSLTGFLYNEVARPVVDKTGLSAKYDFTLQYVPAARASTDESGGPSIFAALEEQLGIKLIPTKAPMDVLVIDSIEPPTAN